MKTIKGVGLCLLALLLILTGGFLSLFMQTSLFSVQVQNFALVGSSGGTITGKLYRPKQASAEQPAPAVLLCPGGNQEYVLHDSLSAQLARQGYVVIAYNAYKHGSSEIRSEETMGAADMLQYVSGLNFVDQSNIGAVGHTLGGAYLSKAAAELPGVLRALVCLDAVSINGSLRDFNSATPINCAWVLAGCDEHQAAGPNPAQELELQRLFGTEKVVEGQLSGSFAQNTARWLHRVPTLSTFLSYSNGTQKAVSEFLGQALVGAKGEYSPWVLPLLQAGRGLALGGMLLLVFGLCRWLLQGAFVALACKAPPALKSASKARWQILALCPLVTAAVYVPLYMLGKRILAPSALFPQTDTNGLAIWAAFAACLYFFAAIFLPGQKQADLRRQELLWEQPRRIGQTLGLAVLTIAAAYGINCGMSLVFSDTIGFLSTNFAVFTPRRWLALASYFPVFLMYFISCGVFEARFLYFRTKFRTGPALHYAGFHALGFALLLGGSWLGFLLQGGPFFFASRFAFMPIPYMLPLLPVMGIIEAWCYRHTGKVYLGAFLNTLLFCWLFVGCNAMFLTL